MTKNALALFIFVACAPGMARAQRQVIDAHAHVTLSEAAVRRAVQIMDENGIVKMVDLSGGFGEQLKSKIELYNKIAPGRFVVFTNMDFSKVNDPQFSKKAMADLEEAYRLGARGLKSFKSLGLAHKDQNGKLIRFDDARFDPVWTKCGELGIPVWFHVGDPAAFFRPPSPDNERHAELSVHPEWSFYGDQFPAREELLTQMVNVVLRHPETTFVTASCSAAIPCSARRIWIWACRCRKRGQTRTPGSFLTGIGDSLKARGATSITRPLSRETGR